MTGVRKRSRVARLRKSVKAISPTIAVLLMIAIAVVASLVVYMWIMGFLNFNTAKAGNAIQIQSVMYTGTHLVVYVQNIGQNALTFTPSQCLYVDGLLRNGASVGIDGSIYVSANRGTLKQTKTASMVDNVTLSLNQKVKLKVVTNEGTWIEAYFTVYTFTGDYTLTLTQNGNGHVDLVPSGPSYYYETVQLNASADPHWTFGDPLWGGALSGNTNPQSILMDGNKAVTVTFVHITHQITFDQTGIGSDFTGNIVMIDGTGYTLPQTFTWNESDTHSFGFPSPLTVGTGKQYVWNSTTGDSTLQSDNFVVPNHDATITGNYGTQYNVTVTATPAATIGGTFKVTYTQSGTAYTDVSQATNWTAWADANTVVTVSGAQDPISGSLTQYVFDHYDPSSAVTMNQANTITLVYRTQYQLTFAVNPTGTGTTTPSGTGWFDAGNLNITAAPTTISYKFTNWSTTDSISFADLYSNSTVATVSGPGTITANFALNTEQITIDSNPEGVGFVSIDGIDITTPQTVTWTAGDTHTLEAYSPVAGPTGTQYNFTGWSDNGDQTHNYTVPASSDTVTANYNTQFQIAFKSLGLGSDFTGSAVTVDGSDYSLPVSFWWDSQTVHSFAFQSPLAVGSEEQYVWIATTGSLSTLQSDTITASGPGNVIGVYQIQYLVTFTVNPSGSGSITTPSTTPAWVYQGFQIQATPAAHYHFLTWTSDTLQITFTGSTSNPTTIASISAPGTITANITIDTFTLTVTVSPTGSGTVTMNPSSGPYPYGTNVTLTPTPSSGMTFDGWSGDVISTQNPLTVNMTSNLALTVTFAPPKLIFASGANQTLAANSLSAPITVQLQDALGNPLPATGTITINLANTGTTGAFYGNILGPLGSPITSITIASGGTTTAQFYYYDTSTTNATRTLTASSTGMTSATTTFTIVVTSYRLTFSQGAAQSLQANTMSAPIQIQAQYYLILWIGVTPNPAITVNLATTSSTGAFYSDAAGTHIITSVTIGGPSGNSTSPYFYYKDSSAGSPTLTASKSGYAPATTTFSIYGAASKLVFIAGAGQTLATGATSTVITVQRQDASGNPTTTGDLIVNLATTSQGGNFLNGLGGAITSVTIANGSSSANLYYRDYNNGNPTLTGSNGSLTPATTRFTITGNTKPVYSTSMTPTVVAAGDRITYQYTITIGENFGGLGYARITIPAGFTGVTVQSATATIIGFPIITWNYAVSNNVITISSPDDLLSWLHLAGDYVTVTFTATAPSTLGSYQFTSYTRQNNDGSGSGPGTLIGVDPSVSVVSAVSITITSSTTGSGYVTVDGTPITTPQTFNWAPGTTHSVAATSIVAGGTGIRYVFANWTDGGAQTHTYTVPSSSATVTANYKTQYQLTVTSAHDSPNPSGSGNWYDSGASVTASVTSPDVSGGTRYNCTGWSGTGSVPSSGTTTTVTFTITQASTITWNWITQYRLTVNSAHDSPNPAVGDTWYNSGASVPASVTSPADVSGGTGYRCTGWSGTGSVPSSGTTTSTTFTISASSTITWNWIVQYQVIFAVSPSGSGSTNPSSGTNWCDGGIAIAISATANTGYGFSSWTAAGPVTIDNPSTASTTATITGEGGTITANFVASITITLRPNAAGSNTGLSRSGDTQNYLCVDEASADGDTTYVYTTSNSYVRDTYAIQDTSATGTINSVTITINCERNGILSSGNARTVLKIGSSYYTGADNTLTTSYTTYSTTYTNNPAGGAWTWAAINALEGGVDLSKGGLGGQARCTQVYITVNYSP